MSELNKIIYNNIDEILRIEDKCNEKCLYCNVEYKEKDRVSHDINDYKKKINKYKQKGTKVISITGGEPTLNKNLFEIIEYINSQGMSAALQTNASLVDNKMAPKLKVSGIFYCLVTLLSSNPETHKELKQADSFKQTISGIKFLLANDIWVVINILVTQKNYKDILDLIKFIKKELPQIKDVSLNFMQPHGRALANKYLLPNYLKIKNEIHDIFKVLRENNFTIGNAYCGLPLCIWQAENTELAEASEFIQNDFLRKNINNKLKIQSEIVIDEKKHNLSCFNCYLRNFCNGYWRELDNISPDEKFIEPQYISYKDFSEYV